MTKEDLDEDNEEADDLNEIYYDDDDDPEEHSILLNVVLWSLGTVSLGTVYSIFHHEWKVVVFSLIFGAVVGLCVGLWKKYWLHPHRKYRKPEE
jgi:hypothetical protein